MKQSTAELLAALSPALAAVEADDQVRASVKDLLRTLTKAVSAELDSLNKMTD